MTLMERIDPRGKILSLWRDLLRNPPKQNLAMSDGLQVLDLTHIDDIISGFALAIDSIDCLHTSTIYTLESTNRIRLRELASVFESLANARLPLDFRRARKCDPSNPNAYKCKSHKMASLLQTGGGIQPRNPPFYATCQAA